VTRKEFELLVATNNEGKILELKKLLSDFPLRLRSLREFADVSDVKETGKSFQENAAIKARNYALQTNLWALADDSGLEVKALHGVPGIFSARYAGENATDRENINKLQSELKKNQPADKFARFVCAMALADEKGEVKFVAKGICDGKISLEARGNKGFGYDPIFIPKGFSETFAELSGDIKQQISHRAQALRKIIQYLRDFHAL